MALLGEVRNIQFLFVHNYRTGGSSLRRGLDQFKKMEIVDAHCTLKSIYEFYSVYNFQYKKPLAYVFKFSFVRNPFDWLVSLYSYIIGYEKHHMHDAVRDKSFSQFLNWFVYKQLNHHNPSAHHFTQKDFLCIGEELGLDYVARFENYNSEVKHIYNMLNIDFSHAEMVNQSNRAGEYQFYYGGNDKRLVEKEFEWELSYGGYTF